MRGSAAVVVAGTAAALVPLVPGWALSTLLPRSLRGRVAPFLASAWLLGAAWCGVSALALSRLAGLPLRRATLLPALLAPLLLAFVVRRCALALPKPRRPGIPAIVASAFAATTCGVLLLQALTSVRDGWDGRMTWAPQARLMRAERTATPAAFREPLALVYHPQYPPLVSLAQVAGLEVASAPDDPRCGRSFHVFFFATFLALLHRAVRLLARDAVIAAGVVALAATTPFLAFANDGGAAGSYSDLPLAAFLGAGLLAALAGRSAASGLATGLLLAGAALTKNEGLPLAAGVALAAAALALAGLRRDPAAARARRLAALVARALPAAVVLFGAVALLHAWRAEIPNRYDEAYGEALRTLRIDAALFGRRVVSVAPQLAAELVSPGSWGAAWPLLALLVLLSPGVFRRRVTLAAAALALGPVAIGLAAYAIAADPAVLATATWRRFLVQGSFGTFLLLGLLASGAGKRPTLARASG